MARKFYLVPESKYRMLLSKDNALFDAKDELDAVLKNKKLAKGVKNAIYNQKLQNVLSTRKEAMNRPMKVELASQGSSLPVPKMMVTVATDTKGLKGKPRPPPAPHASPEDVSDEEQNFEGGETSSQTESEYEEIRAESAPATPTGRPGTSRITRGQGIDPVLDRGILAQKVEALRELEAHVFANKDLFQISDTGRILGRNNVEIKNSDAKKALKHIIYPMMTSSPGGYDTLKKRLLADPTAKEIIAKSVVSGERLSAFRPRLWNY